MVKKLFSFLYLRISVIIAILVFVPSSGNGATLSIVLEDVNSAPYTTWTISPAVTLNTATTMTSAQGVKAVIQVKPKADFSAVVTSTGPWTAGLVQGLNVYKLELKAFSFQQGTPDLTNGAKIILGTATLFDTNVKAGDTWIYAKFTTPTATTSGKLQTITVTITVSVH